MKAKEFITKKLFKSKKNVIFSCLALALTLILTVITGIKFKSFSEFEPYFYGKEEGNNNVTEVEHFSDYCSALKDTTGDANIYVMKGQEEGPSILILGGTHPNEPSGQLTATVLLENLKVNKGTVYIITETNRSAYTHSYPQEGSPFYYSIVTSNGTSRTFKYGSRATNTNDQWPNPDIYVHEYSGQKLSTSETRNMNRAYPGLEDGTFTEQCAYAVTNLIRSNDIVLTVDLHEASPEYKTINAIIAHSLTDTGTDGALYLAGKVKSTFSKHPDIEKGTFETLSVDRSPEMHGLTHRELGDHTNTLPMIMETSNASQGKYRGAFTEGTILYNDEDNLDDYYEYIAKLDETTSDTLLYARPTTIEERVARHASCIADLLYQYNYRFFSESLDEDAKNQAFKKSFAIDEGDVFDTPTSIKYETTKKLIDSRKEMGKFDIDFSSITGSNIKLDDYVADETNPTVQTELSKNTAAVYNAIYNNPIGNFLHDQPSK